VQASLGQRFFRRRGFLRGEGAISPSRGGFSVRDQLARTYDKDLLGDGGTQTRIGAGGLGVGAMEGLPPAGRGFGVHAFPRTQLHLLKPGKNKFKEYKTRLTDCQV